MREIKNKVNLHTHTCLCKHAEGTAADYCAEAVKQGVSVLGFSDHSPLEDDSPISGSRMSVKQLPEYQKQIDDARAAFPQLKILAGFEIDFSRKLGADYYRDHFFHEFKSDYCIGGVHFVYLELGHPYVKWTGERLTMSEFRKAVEDSIYLMETGLITYLAHPDMCMVRTDRLTDEHKAILKPLFEASLQLDVPLEINAYGMRKPKITGSFGQRWQYPFSGFWEYAAECGITKAAAGSDAHTPGDVWGNIEDAFDFGAKFGIEICNAELAEKIMRKRETNPV